MVRGYSGEILPRDYGLMIRKGGENLFVSPSKFAFGLAHLEYPSDLERRIRDIARRRGETVRDVGEALKNAVRSRAPGLWMKGRSLQDVSGYTDDGYSACIQSKSDTNKVYAFNISHIDISSHIKHHRLICSCEDGRYGILKKVHVMCSHTSAFALALDMDDRSELSVEENFSGLPPKERLIVPSIPFRYYARKNAHGLSADQVMSDILFDILVDERKHFDVNRQVLDNPHMFALWTAGAMRDKYDSAQFEVLREKERECSRLRVDASIKSLTIKISERLTSQGCIPTRYVLAFKGTDFESVARRFRKGNTVYDLVVNDSMLPILVRKILGKKAENLWNGDDVRTDHPYMRNEEYSNVDDATRNMCDEKIIIPTQHPDLSKLVSQEVKNAYERALMVGVK